MLSLKAVALYLITVLSFILTACTSNTEVGTKKNPIKLFLIPGQDAQILEDNGKKVTEFLEKKTNLHFDIKVPTSYIAVVEAFGSKKADVAIMNTFGYILAHEKYGVEAKLMGIHFGQKYYQGQIITRKGHLKSLEDINGKKFAYVDPASTSGFLMPTDLMRKKNIKPKEFVFAGKHDTVIAMLYQKQVDAGATFYTPSKNGVPQDARKLVLTQFPDVFEKIEILKLTDPIPNDPIVFRSELDQEIKEKIKHALIEYLKTDDGKDTFMKLYNMNGVISVDDTHYDQIRNTLKELGKTAQEFIKK
jgi:phosphonate transport system substrate-binding protein